MAAWIEEKTESKQDNPKTSSETKSVAHQTGFVDENRKPNARERKIRKPQREQLQNTPQFIYMSLNENSVYSVMPRSSKPPDTCK